MVQLLSLITLVTAALGVNASLYCQCLFPDGSHCCVATVSQAYFHPEFTVNLSHFQVAGDCTAGCMHAARWEPYSGGALEPENTPCNAGGKYSKVGLIAAQGRTQCDTRQG